MLTEPTGREAGTITVIVSMVGFWILHGRELPTRAEVRSMIATEAPYVADRKLVMERLTDVAENSRDLSKAINEFRVELARLRARITPEIPDR